MSPDNPARRLHQLLTQFCEIGQENGNRNVASSQVWASTFEISKDDDSALMGYAEAFYSLLAQTRQAIKKLPVEDHGPYIQSLNSISATMSQHGFFNQNWANLGNAFRGGATMAMLIMTADAIDRDVDLVGLSEEQLKELLESTKTLLDDVVSSNLEEKLKSYLVIQLEEILAAIRHYQVSGSEGLRRVINANIGGALLKSMGLSDKSEQKDAWRRFLELMLKFGGLLGLAADTNGYLLPKLEEFVKKLPPAS